MKLAVLKAESSLIDQYALNLIDCQMNLVDLQAQRILTS
uniref:Uncharacterized protein n=1 Tax=Setaria italica TaxID=4555 RepID=K3YF13_SETIT